MNRAHAPLLALMLAALAAPAAPQTLSADPPQAVVLPVEVHTALGGFILGYDVDPFGKLGLLAEAKTLENGNHDVAVETFDARTGQILNVVVQELNSKNDYLALGVVGSHAGLVEFEHVSGLFVDQRLYALLDPLSSRDFTSAWTPPLGLSDIIGSVSVSQQQPETAVMAFRNSGSFQTLVFGSDVAANSFGPVASITDPNFSGNHAPVMALDSVNHRAILGSLGPNAFGPPRIGKVNLQTGAFTSFTGVGIGYVNGIAVDSQAGLACTTTEIDFRIEIYNLATQTGFSVPLHKALSQAHSGRDVQLDPLHKLFLVGQTISSTAPSGSSVQVFDEQGHFLEAIDGLQLPASSSRLALSPHRRIGFVLKAPDLTSLQSFTY
jgi:hypothetical protein